MSNNYLTKTKKQYEQSKFKYQDFVEDSGNPFFINDTNVDFVSVEEEMTGSIYKMRRDFKKSTKKLLNLYSNKEPKESKYEAAKNYRVHLKKQRATM
jgi:hypothetical protein